MGAFNSDLLLNVLIPSGQLLDLGCCRRRVLFGVPPAEQSYLSCRYVIEFLPCGSLAVYQLGVKPLTDIRPCFS
jgi:hypothetical protein